MPGPERRPRVLPRKYRRRLRERLTRAVAVNISALHRLRGLREISARLFGFPDMQLGDRRCREHLLRPKERSFGWAAFLSSMGLPVL